jgi:hypothetical protein
LKERVEVGDEAFVSDGDAQFGAVRRVSRNTVVVYVENSGGFEIPLSAVSAVHSKKVI